MENHTDEKFDTNFVVGLLQQQPKKGLPKKTVHPSFLCCENLQQKKMIERKIPKITFILFVLPTVVTRHQLTNKNTHTLKSVTSKKK